MNDNNTDKGETIVDTNVLPYVKYLDIIDIDDLSINGYILSSPCNKIWHNTTTFLPSELADLAGVTEKQLMQFLTVKHKFLLRRNSVEAIMGDFSNDIMMDDSFQIEDHIKTLFNLKLAWQCIDRNDHKSRQLLSECLIYGDLQRAKYLRKSSLSRLAFAAKG